MKTFMPFKSFAFVSTLIFLGACASKTDVREKINEQSRPDAACVGKVVEDTVGVKMIPAPMKNLKPNYERFKFSWKFNHTDVERNVTFVTIRPTEVVLSNEGLKAVGTKKLATIQAHAEATNKKIHEGINKHCTRMLQLY